MGWKPDVLATSAETGQGIDPLIAKLDDHRAHLNSSGEHSVRLREIAEMRVLKAAEDIARHRVGEARDNTKDNAFNDVHDRSIDPYGAALNLMKAVK
jgi:LAO/AO transport system kinase